MPIRWIEQAEAKRIAECAAETREGDLAVPRQQPAALAERRGVLARLLSVWPLREANAC